MNNFSMMFRVEFGEFWIEKWGQKRFSRGNIVEKFTFSPACAKRTIVRLVSTDRAFLSVLPDVFFWKNP
jgi:hypothetical protein